MNGIHGLPGFEALFRENRRLASKLTSDEVRAIRNYIEDRINKEQADTLFRLYALQNDFDVTVRKSSDTIQNLYQELTEKKETIKKYQDSDEKITSVHKQKEARWEKKQELMVGEIEKLEGENTRNKTKLKHVEEQLDVKTNIIGELEEKLDDFEEAVQTADEAKRIVEEKEQADQDLLKLKMELDKRDRLIRSFEEEIKTLKKEIERVTKEKKYNDMKVTTMQEELKKQVREVAEKCKELTDMQFQLQMEKQQAEALQKGLRQAAERIDNYKEMLETRPPLSARDPTVIVLKKDMDIMDIRIKSLDIGVRLRMDEIKKIEDRIEDLIAEERLAAQMKNEVYLQGDTYIEMTASELVKKLSFKHKRLNEELRYAKDWEHGRREADMLRSEITAMMKQAAICKVVDLGSRSSKQLQKIELIMRGTNDNKMPKIYKVSERSVSEQRHLKLRNKQQQPAFLSASTPVSGLDSQFSPRKTSVRSRKKLSVGKGKLSRQSLLENYTDDNKIYYWDTDELDLSNASPAFNTPRRGNQSDRMTMQSVSTSTIDVITEH